MLTGLNIPNNITVADLVTIAYGDMGLTYKLLKDNPWIINPDFDLTFYAGRLIFYDPALKVAPPQVNVPAPVAPNNLATYVGKEGQSLEDVCMMTYMTLDLMYKLLQDNSIQSIELLSVRGINFIYDTTLVADNLLQKKNRSINRHYCTGNYFPGISSGASFDDSFDDSFDEG